MKTLSRKEEFKEASLRLGIPFLESDQLTVDPSARELLSLEAIRTSGILPYHLEGVPGAQQQLSVAVTDPALLEKEAPPIIQKLAASGYLLNLALILPETLTGILLGPDIHSPRATPSEIDQPVSTIPEIDLKGKTLSLSILERLPEETARKYRLVVFDLAPDGQTLKIAVDAPDRRDVQDLLKFIADKSHLRFELFLTDRASIDAALAQYEVSINPPAPVQPAERTPRKIAGKRAGVKSDTPRVPPPTPPEVIEMRPKDQPDLRVEATDSRSLIPLTGDVERDLDALVGQSVGSVAELETIIETGFIPKIVGALIMYAVGLRASDIHIQSEEKHLLIRYRIDGILEDIVKLPANLQPPLVSRIKILAKLKIDEQRIPQDGRFDAVVEGREVDFRISTFPTIHGEKIVLRLLDKSGGLLKFKELGLTGSRVERLEREIKKPYGVILSTGPTGSGKTTTLYAILQEVAGPGVNVVTLEDPVEYEIDGISQAQIKPKIGFGFADGLRSILRQDPDIIMVGEVRDSETAGMMIHAALTGHLVLSTLHTNDAAGALPRLINMGVEPFLITSAINAVMAQRLVRKLCETCKEAWSPPQEMQDDLLTRLKNGNNPEIATFLEEKPSITLHKVKGCAACHDGFRGRIGLFEVLIMTETIEALAVKKAPGSDIVEAAVKEGMITMEQDGLMKALTGQTTLDEVLRVTKAE